MTPTTRPLPDTYAPAFRMYLNAVAVYDAAAREFASTLNSDALNELHEAEKGLTEAALNLAAGVYEHHTTQPTDQELLTQVFS